MTRRRFLAGTGAAGLTILLSGLLPAYATEPQGLTTGLDARAPGEPIDLYLGRKQIDIGGRKADVIALNGTVPGPLVRLREGEDATVRVHNELDEDSSVHWHGILLPFEMDGVPGVSYPGIRPGETFTYRFAVRQSGTYWYHSHTRLQEQLGQYGPLIIDPARPDPVVFDREYVVVLSDWTFENPYKILAKLKKMSDYYNFQQPTVGDFFKDASAGSFRAAARNRLAWARMNMSPTDIADITGYTYTYLMNGLAPESNWTGLFKPGERVRLRFINAATMSYFNVRIPGLPMTVVQADGQNVAPVETDEFQISVAETYDIIVRPDQDKAYTIFAESMDRSGYTRGTLAPRPGMAALVPALRPPPLRAMTDMGMDMGKMEMNGMKVPPEKSGAMTSTMGGIHGDSASVGQSGMSMTGGSGMVGQTRQVVARHGPDHHGPGNVSVAEVQYNRLEEPGTGLANTGHRVLVYSDLRRRASDFDARPVDRELEMHLTGNMERYMWSFDGKKFSEVKAPIDETNEDLAFDPMLNLPVRFHFHGWCHPQRRTRRLAGADLR